MHTRATLTPEVIARIKAIREAQQEGSRPENASNKNHTSKDYPLASTLPEFKGLLLANRVTGNGGISGL